MTNIPSWARVGQKVICVNPFHNRGLGEQHPIKGDTYTIRGILDLNHKTGLWLTEIRNTPRQYQEGVFELAFLVSDFKPLITRTLEQDMEIFAPLLKVERELADVE